MANKFKLAEEFPLLEDFDLDNKSKEDSDGEDPKKSNKFVLAETLEKPEVVAEDVVVAATEDPATGEVTDLQLEEDITEYIPKANPNLRKKYKEKKGNISRTYFNVLDEITGGRKESKTALAIDLFPKDDDTWRSDPKKRFLEEKLFEFNTTASGGDDKTVEDFKKFLDKGNYFDREDTPSDNYIALEDTDLDFSTNDQFKNKTVLGIIPYEDTELTERQPIINKDGISVNQEQVDARTGEYLTKLIKDVNRDGKRNDLDKTFALDDKGKKIKGEKVFVDQMGKAVPYADAKAVDLYTVIYQDEDGKIKGYKENERVVVDVNDRGDITVSSDLDVFEQDEFIVTAKRDFNKEIKAVEDKIANAVTKDDLADYNLELKQLKHRQQEDALKISDSDDNNIARETNLVYSPDFSTFYGGDENVAKAVENVQAVKDEIRETRERLDYLSKNRQESKTTPGAQVITDEEIKLKNKLERLTDKDLVEANKAFNISRANTDFIVDSEQEYNSAVENINSLSVLTKDKKFNESKFLEHGFLWDKRNNRLHANVPRDFTGRPIYIDPGDNDFIDVKFQDNMIGSILGNEEMFFDIDYINSFDINDFSDEGKQLIDSYQKQGKGYIEGKKEAIKQGLVNDQDVLRLEETLNSQGSQFIEINPEDLNDPKKLEEVKQFLANNANPEIKLRFDQERLKNLEYYSKQEERQQHQTSTKLNDLLGTLTGYESPVHQITARVNASSAMSGGFIEALEFYGEDALANQPIVQEILNNNKLSDERKIKLLEKKGFTVDENGNITGKSQSIYETTFNEYDNIPIKDFELVRTKDKTIYDDRATAIAKIPMVYLKTPSGIEFEMHKHIYDQLDNKTSVKDQMIVFEDEIKDQTLEYLDLQDDVDYMRSLQMDNMVEINQLLKLNIKKSALAEELAYKEGGMGMSTNFAEANLGEMPAIVINRVSSNLAKSMGGVGALFARTALLIESPWLSEKEEADFERKIELLVTETEGLEKSLELEIDDEFNKAYNNSFFGQALGTGIDMLVDVLINRGAGLVTGGPLKSIGRKAWKNVLKTQTKKQISKRGIKEGMKFLSKVNPAMFTRQYGDYERQFKDPRFDGMTSGEKLTYAAGMSFLISKMDRLGIETAAGKGGDKIAEAIFRKALQSGKKGKLRKILNTELKEQIAKGVIKLGTGGLGESITEVVQEITEGAGQTLVNSIKGFDGKEEGFEGIDWGSEKWFEDMKRIMQVSFFSAGPSSIFSSAVEVVGSAKKMNNLLKLDEDNFNQVYAVASSPEAIADHKKFLSAQVASGQKTQKEADQEWKDVQDLAASFEGVPIGLKYDKAKAIYENNLEIIDLKKSKENKNDSAKKVIDEKIKILEEANNNIINQVSEDVTQTVDGKDITTKVAKDKYKSKAAKTIDKKIKGLKKAYAEAGISEELTVDQQTEITETFTESLQEAVANGDITQEQAEQNLKDFKLDNITLKVAESSQAADALSNNSMLETDQNGNTVRADASYDPLTNTIVIDKQKSIAIGATNAQNHEALHHVLAKTLEENPEAAFSLATALATELDKLDPDKVQNSELKKRLELYKNKESDIQAEELLTLFSDAVETGDIVMNDGVFSKIGDLSRRRIQDKTGATISFETAEDVYNFIKDYNKSISKGKFTEAQKSLFKKGAKIGKGIKADEKKFKEQVKKTFKTKPLTGKVDKSKDKKSISSLKDFDKLNWRQYNTKKEFQRSPEFIKAADFIYNDKLFAQQIANKLFDGNVEDVKSDLAIHLSNFDPSQQKGEGGSLGAWMGGQFLNKIIGVGESAMKDQGVVSLDNTMNDSGTSFADSLVGDEGKTMGETKKPKPVRTEKTLDQKLKISKATNSIVENAVEKINWTKLKSIEEGTGTIPTITPFISDIRKEIGPELQPAIITEMGGSKKGPAFDKFLDENLETLIEELPIQYIAGSVFKPFHKDLIEKSVGGKYVDSDGKEAKSTDKDVKFIPNFTTEWQGKKVDRVKTRDTGNTAGPQLMRLKPGWKNNLDLDGIKKQFIKPNGSANQTRQEGLAYQIGAELGLDKFGTDLKNEKSKIRENFIKFQTELANRELADNFVEKITDQIDRSLTKKSMSFVRGLNPTQAIAFELGKKDFIKNLNGDFSSKNIKRAVEEVYGNMATEEGNVFNGVTKTKMKDGLFKTIKQYTDILEQTKQMPSEFKTVDSFIDEELKGQEFDKSLAAVLDIKDADGKKLTFGKTFKDPVTIGTARDTTYNVYKNKINQRIKEGLTLDEAVAEEFSQILKWDVDHLTSSAKIGDGTVFVDIKKGDNKSPNKGVGSDLMDSGNAGRQGYQVYQNKADLIMNTLNKLSEELKSDIKADFDWKRDKDKLDDEGNVIKKGEWKIDNPRVVNSKTGEVLSSTKNNDYKTPPQKSSSVIAEIKKDGEQAVAVKREKAANEAFDRIKTLMQGVKDQLKNPDTATSKVDLGMMMMSLKSNMASILRSSAVPTYMYQGDFKVENINKDLVYEHIIPAEVMAMALIDSYFNPNSELNIDELQDMYQVAIIPEPMDNALKVAGYQYSMPSDWKQALDRYFNERTKGAPAWILKSMADGKINEDSKIARQAYELTNKPKTKKKNSLSVNASNVVKVNPTYDSNQEILDIASTLDKALAVARDPNAPVKKIRVFDFDDTLAQTKSNVLYTMPDGTTGKLTAEQFAKKGDMLLAQGAVWDFSEFNKVVDGKPGPLLELGKKIQKARGTEDVFVLTARAPEAQLAIKEYLDSVGLNIPIKNITGLGNSSPYAKSFWMVKKAAEGYNDFYFADDHISNVRAVRDAMEQIDVKSKVQQAKIKQSLSLNETINNIIENKSGIENYKIYSEKRGKKLGGKNKKFSIIPPSAEDFVGLLYRTLGKGKIGNAQMAWYKSTLLDPYARAMNDISRFQQSLQADFRALKKELIESGNIPKNLRKEAIDGFTFEDAVRILAWDKQGINIDGLSKRDLQMIKNLAESNPEINLFADQLIAINKGSGYSYPGANWDVGNITTDLRNSENYRKKALQEWQDNVDVVFSKENMNKMEAAFGNKWREAMENMLTRMRTGKNRNQSVGRLEGRVLDYLNNSVGAVMFLNTRSAVLQTISALNFINMGDNNPIAAGKAFANQKQYWSDFTMLMNSDFLRERRGGMKLNVSESEIADAAATSSNKVKGVINYLLNKGFLPTQIADSFAIASGGATFYRNRVKKYLDEGFSIKEAEVKAFEDFRETAEESQQSSRPDRISQQQAGGLGRVVLAFANTPAQYSRLIKKATLDLVNGRGDWKTNLSKIAYYGFVQNLIFNTLQQAIFALAFGDDDEEDEEKNKKYFNVANGMLDSLLRGLGLGGAIVSLIKNMGIELDKQMDKDPFFNEDAKAFPGADYDKVAMKELDLSPPLDVKISKMVRAGDNWKYNNWRPEATDPFDIDNPAYESAALVIASTTNIPVDRLFQKMENIRGALDENNATWKRVFMALGWSEWQLLSSKEKEQKKIEDKNLKRKTRGKDDPGIYTKTQQVDILKQHGLSDAYISTLKNEEERVAEIKKQEKKNKKIFTSNLPTPGKEESKSKSKKIKIKKPSWKKLKIK